MIVAGKSFRNLLLRRSVGENCGQSDHQFRSTLFLAL
jgi:hypothetical protein